MAKNVACWLALALLGCVGCRHLVILEGEVQGKSIAQKYDNAFEWVESFDGAEVPDIALRPGPQPGAFDERRIDPDGRQQNRVTAEAPRTTLLSFVHLSDAQVRDERVRFGGRKFSRSLDKLLPVTEYGEDQQRYDGSVYLALVKTLNRWADGFEDAADADAKRRFPLFMAHTGDSIHAGVLQELYEFLWITAQLELPWLQLIGNHDITAFGTDLFPVTVRDPRLGYFPIYDSRLFMHLHGDNATARRRLFRPGVYIAPAQSGRHDPTSTLLGDDRHHGFDLDKGLSYYSVVPPWVGLAEGDEPDFDSEEFWRARLDDGFRVRFVFLDTTADGELHRGGIDPGGEQMRWLRAELEQARTAGEHVVAFGHHDLKRSFRTGAEELSRMFAEQPGFLGYFCGHTHKQEMRVVCAGDEGSGGGTQACFWQVIGPPIIEWPQSGLLARLVRLGDDRLAWDLTPFTHGFEGAPGESLDVDHPDPTERLRAQVLTGRASAKEDYHRGDPDEEIRQPALRLLIPAAATSDASP